MTNETTKPRRTVRRIEAWRAFMSDRQPDFFPVEITASTVVRHVLTANPGLAEAAMAPGAITILKVADAEWVTPIQEAWVQEIHRTSSEDAGTTWPDEAEDDESAVEPAWYGFARDGSTRHPDLAELRRRVLLALHSGKPVYGFSHDPDGLLPPELMRLADRIVTVPPLSPEVLAEALDILTGAPPTLPIPEALARATSLADVAVAWRPGETADGVLDRLRRLRGNEASAMQDADRLENLIGMDQARDWGLGLVRDLPAYRAGRLRWQDIEDAVLLAGPPGCGKTTFARRLTRSLGVPLLTGSPQVWQSNRDGHLGHALAAMHATFREARAAAPCVLFLDELDSMGNRANFADQNRDYGTAYLNGLLEELDGTSGLEGVIVVAACNHPSRLDPALIRAGRLNRVLHIDYPDEDALAGILRQRLGADLVDADLSLVVRHARDATGADVEAWVRGARSRARHEDRPITLDDLLTQVRPPDVVPAQIRRRAAVHEAGHAVVGWLDRPGSIVRLSLSAGPDAGGVVRSLAEDRLMTRASLDRTLRRLLAGRAAEELLLGDVSSGAGGPEGSDLSRATLLAATAILSWGFGSRRDVQPLLWRGEPTAATLRQTLVQQPAVAREVHDMLASAYEQTRVMLRDNRAALIRVVCALLDREVIEGDELGRLLNAPDAVGGAERTTPTSTGR